MPEDQNYDGDIWNKEACELLKSLNWIQIGDHDMDVKNEDGAPKGIDTLIEYELFTNSKNGIVLEAKAYKTNTFYKSPNLLEKWVNILHEKVLSIKYSSNLYDLYPNVCNTIFRDGLIVIWFKDVENYDSDRFFKLYESVNIRRSARNISKPNRIFVLENSNILRLISLKQHIDKLCLGENKFIFHYPSGDQSASVIHSNVISLEYLYSKFVIGEVKNSEGKRIKKVIFYFGNVSLKNFYRLKSALSMLQFLEREVETLLFVYKRDDENLRKIFPEITKVFMKDINNFEFSEMDQLANLPSWITKTKY